MTSPTLQFFATFKRLAVLKTQACGFFHNILETRTDSNTSMEHWDCMTLSTLKSLDTKLFLSVHYNVTEQENMVLYHDKFRELTNIISGGLKGIYKSSGLDELRSSIPGQTFGFLYSMLHLKQEFPDICYQPLEIDGHNVLLSLALSANKESSFHRITDFHDIHSSTIIQNLQD